MRVSVSMENWDYRIVRDFEPPLLIDLIRTSTHRSSFIPPFPDWPQFQALLIYSIQ